MLVYLSIIEDRDEKTKFEAIYYAYKGLMFYVANRILDNPQDAEDVVHQSFLKIIDLLENIATPQCPQTRSLVVTITERKALDVYRRRKRRTVLPIDEENMQTAVPTTIDGIAESSAIAQAIAALPPKYRALLLLKYDSGYSEKEVAHIMGMSEANVKKTIQRAKAKLQTYLEELEVEL
ncbi:MAG: sigma-70 family RNA polymerase sigma factor [Eubacteriales bacterium]|nr:sigma-70 family RNA polymerase sigma factor [Eubacteriales bacterium]